ncbi:MAG TPA: nitric oxide reductase activation protein NorD [Burkholderiales bacterium]|nr:nitric oxide reductase activation protein NorD [Burkholderiales bacterium]
MSLHLDDYAELLEELPEDAQGLLRASWTEAAKVFSPRGLQEYLDGALAMKRVGRGADLVSTFVQEAPEVARAVGEDAVPELAGTIMAMASKTSGAVLALVLAMAPKAAERLGDEKLFLAYLAFLNNLLAQAPRGVRPMLEQLDRLLGQLTLGGLRRWASWGAQAYRTDFAGQVRYFSLLSPDALQVLQQERKGTLFVDVQRRINMYLRALWARDFFLRPTSGDYESREGYRPYVEEYFIHLPDALDDFAPPGGEGQKVPGLELYRAAAAHCAAHIVYTREPISAEALNPLQMALISAVEDARVEALAIRRFPGLAQLWSRLHCAEPSRSATVGDWLNRLARALLDESYLDDDPWIAQGRVLFREAGDRLDSHEVSVDIGLALAHTLAAKRIPYNPRSDVLSAPYRDDNRYFWEFEEFDPDQAAGAGYETVKQVRRHVSLMEFANEVDVETAGDDAQEIWVLGTELFPYEDNGVSYNEMEGREPVSDPYHYPEWDYQIQLQRPSWATVLERRPKYGDLAVIEDIAAANRKIVNRMKYLLDAMQPQGVQRIRKLEDGDEVDLNAAIRSVIDMRMGLQPDPRIMMRSVRKTRDIAVLVLLDVSESTNDKVHGQDYTVLDLTRAATVLLADAIHRIGDPFAIHGFASDGRHDVQYFRFKDFDQPYNEVPKARLAGMSGQLSTRMGAAIRHAGHYLAQRKAARRLLLVVTDGEPADVDVRDPQYLRHDTKKAVEELARNGITTFCMSLDPRADQYVSRIFGARNYAIVDHVERLPEKLPALYVGLTR